MTQPPHQQPDQPRQLSTAQLDPDRPFDHPAGRHRRKTALVAGLAVGGACLLGFGALGVSTMSLSAGNRTAEPPPADDPVVATPPPGSPDHPGSGQEPAGSTAEPAAGARTAEPDPLTGSPYARPVLALADNPINVPGNGAVNTSCPLPRFATDLAAQNAFYQAAAPCLMRMWAPSLRAADLPVRLPSVVTVAQQAETPCGKREWDQTAMYCPGDNTIYMTARYYAEKENRTNGGAFLGQFSHEFGHAVQSMAGINRAYTDTSARVGGESPAGLELTRRSELQATCFEGMALASFQNGGAPDDLIYGALADSRARGDEYNPQPDHGHVATNAEWINRGFTTNRITQCNTWAAPPSSVD